MSSSDGADAPSCACLAAADASASGDGCPGPQGTLKPTGDLLGLGEVTDVEVDPGST